MDKINILEEKLVDMKSKLKALNEKTLSNVEKNQKLQEKAIYLDNHLQDLIRDYRDALDEEQQLDSELTKLGIDKKAEDDLHSFMEKLRALGWSMLPSSTVKDEPPMYKFDFIKGYSLTIQIQDNRMKLIEMEPLNSNFENIQNEITISQDLMGLLMTIKELATAKAGVKCS